MARKIPIDVSSFKRLRTSDYIYVDKTKHIYDIATGGRLYFLSRPRRFGKSLFISTLRDLFESDRELFKDLWIDKESDYEWLKRPVIHLDFSNMPISSGDALEKRLSWKMEEIGNAYEIDVSRAPDLGAKLKLLLTHLSSENSGVVILIDEYDYPLVNNLDKPEIALENHAVLKGFFSTLKSLDEYIQFLMVTGVTQFAKASLFSGMNNLNDLTFDQRAGNLLGYTQEEIIHYFPDDIKRLAEAERVSFDETVRLLKAWYDGYRFCENPLYVHNPFSVLYALHKKNLLIIGLKRVHLLFLFHY